MQPNTKQGRKSREYQENFGSGFYDRLRNLTDLTVLADEWHSYETKGPFQAAITGLDAQVIVGLTATPTDKQDSRIVFRYPLAAAIADGYVKVPVILGRADARDDVATQLADGLKVIEYKRARAEQEAAHLGKRINPVLLVVAKDISDATSIENIINNPNFVDGKYAGTAIRIDSSKPSTDADWEHLKNAENPDSHVRVIISVGMLKEGWDVANVYAILSTRAMASQLLTEQTMGRGLRLPYHNARTGIELLDSLDILAHTKYEILVETATATLDKEFFSYKERLAWRYDINDNKIIDRRKEPVKPSINPHSTTLGDSDGLNRRDLTKLDGVPGVGNEPVESGSRTAPDSQANSGFTVQETGDRLQDAQTQADRKTRTVELRPDIAASLRIPIVHFQHIAAPFSLSEITDRSPFYNLGKQLSADRGKELQRKIVKVTRTEPQTVGGNTLEITTEKASDTIIASRTAITVEAATTRLVAAIMQSDIVSANIETAPQERNIAKAIVERFITGLNGDAPEILASILSMAQTRLLAELTKIRKQVSTQTRIVERIGYQPLRDEPRPVTRPITSNRNKQYPLTELRGIALTGWKKSGYGIDWFDSNTERKLAILMDEDNEIIWWIRLQPGDFQIEVYPGKTYRPDYIVKDKNRYWVVEVKQDDKEQDEDSQIKRQAALKWVNLANSSDQLPDGNSWGYIYATETDIKDATHSWTALKAITQADSTL